MDSEADKPQEAGFAEKTCCGAAAEDGEVVRIWNEKFVVNQEVKWQQELQTHRAKAKWSAAPASEEAQAVTEITELARQKAAVSEHASKLTKRNEHFWIEAERVQADMEDTGEKIDAESLNEACRWIWRSEHCKQEKADVAAMHHRVPGAAWTSFFFSAVRYDGRGASKAAHCNPPKVSCSWF